MKFLGCLVSFTPLCPVLSQFVLKYLIKSGVIFTSLSKNNSKVVAAELNARWNDVKTFMVWGKRQCREKMLRLFPPCLWQSEMSLYWKGTALLNTGFLQCKIQFWGFFFAFDQGKKWIFRRI